MGKRGHQRPGAPSGEAAIDPAVAAVIDGTAPAIRKRLLELRGLIYETAAKTEGVGALVESLKWAEPAYRPKAPRVGTTIRMNAVKGTGDMCALFFHCQTNLVETFRELYPALRYEGNRALLLDVRQPLPREALAHCFAMALTYHRQPARKAA